MGASRLRLAAPRLYCKQPLTHERNGVRGRRAKLGARNCDRFTTHCARLKGSEPPSSPAHHPALVDLSQQQNVSRLACGRAERRTQRRPRELAALGRDRPPVRGPLGWEGATATTSELAPRRHRPAALRRRVRRPALAQTRWAARRSDAQYADHSGPSCPAPSQQRSSPPPRSPVFTSSTRLTMALKRINSASRLRFAPPCAPTGPIAPVLHSTAFPC